MMQGKSGLAYTGVNALRPPDVSYMDRAPTVNDYLGYDLMHLWHVITGSPHTYQLWYLADKNAGLATWLSLYPNTGPTSNGWLRSDDGGIEIPDPAWGAVNVFGGEAYGGNVQYINMYTTKYDDYTLNVNLKRSIFQPNTNAAGTEGLYSLGEHDFLHNFGTDNTACGGDALNRNLDTPTAVSNTAIGHEALHSIGTGAMNSALGSGALADVIGGSFNIAIGYDAGGVYNLNESSNIIIGTSLGIVGDTHTIRIGNMGVGDGEQDKVFVAGIWNCPVIPAKNTGLVIVDDSGELYVDDIAPFAVICTDVGGNPVGKVGLDGEVLIGATGASPEWKTLTAGPGIGIANGPNSITLTAGGVGAVVQLGADDGHTALPVGAQINIVGANLLETSVTPDLGQDLAVGINKLGLAAQVIGANGVGVDPTWKTLACSDGSLDIIHTPAGIDITVIGVPPAAGVNYLMDHALQHVTPTNNGILIEQGDNIETIGDIALSKITVRVTDSVELPNGHMYARDDIETTAGNFLCDNGYLRLPDTGVGLGDIRFRVGLADQIYFHKYGIDNIFLGRASGNTALVANAFNNTCCGSLTGAGLTTGQRNSAFGYSAMRDNTTGNQNTCLGEGAMIQSTVSNYNLCVGYHAGFSLLAGTVNNSNIYVEHPGYNAESNTIRIGQHGVTAHHHSHCYVAGIYGSTTGASAQMVVCSKVVTGGVTDYKLSTQDIPDAGATTYQTDSGNAVPAAGILQVKGGYNIGTRGAGNIIYVDLDNSVQQDITAVDGTKGVYALGARGANTYSANRFMHAWGGGLGMHGYNTFLGHEAGRIDVGAVGVGNTAIGSNALDAYINASNNVAIGKSSLGAATSASNNVCVGTLSGSAITTGGYNTLVGDSAGSGITTGTPNTCLGASSGTAYTTEQYNITLDHAGVVGDLRTMRLGWNTQYTWVVDKLHPNGYETRTVRGVDATYIYGIYASTIDDSATPVYVDQTGHLGTNGGVSFSMHQETALTNKTGDGTVYTFGASGGIVVDFDNTGAITNPGNTRTYFTAPYSGKYVFTASITYVVPAGPVVKKVSPLYLVTSGKSYMFAATVPDELPGVPQYVSEIVTAFVYLDAYDIAFWQCQVSGGAKTIGIHNKGLTTYGGVAYYPYATYFTGYRMS